MPLARSLDYCKRMKTLFSILIAAGVGFGAAFFLMPDRGGVAGVSGSSDVEWQARVDQLEKELAAARSRPGRAQHSSSEAPIVVAGRRSPQEILDKLLTLKPAGDNRIATIRKIVHELEDLAELKDEAVPAIRQFLAQNSDLDYSVERTEEGDRDRRGFTPPWVRNRATTEFILPPSLRMGLFDVLKEIGGSDAEQALAEVLGSSGRAVEVAYVARMLEEMAPGSYRDVAIEAAKSLLRNPVSIDNPNRLDEAAEGYLYGVLELFGDTSFAEEAKKLLVEDGRLDRNVRDYLTKTQGEKAVPLLYEAYKNTTFSNEWDKASIASRILDYAGPNADANKLLNEIVGDPNVDSRMKAFAIMRLAGGFGDAESPKDPEVIKARLNVVGGIARDLTDAGNTDERLTRAIVRTDENLNKLLNGESIDTGRDFFRGDRDRGDRGTPPATAPAPQPN